jgi:hypothetical protein
VQSLRTQNVWSARRSWGRQGVSDDQLVVESPNLEVTVIMAEDLASVARVSIAHDMALVMAEDRDHGRGP